ncbi:MAG: hypothetical protein AAGI44_06665, partial [Pseudomonadota bacterium]
MSTDTSQQHRTEWVVFVAIIVGMLMMAQLVASQAVRDGFFLSYYDVSALPAMIAAAAAWSVVFVLTLTHLLRNVAPARSVPWLFIANGVLFFLEWSLSTTVPKIAAAVLYLHVLSLGMLVMSGYWSVVSERFDPYTAKRNMGRIGGGVTLGGALGGGLVWWGAAALPIDWMLFGLGIANMLCAMGVWRLGQGAPVSTRMAGNNDSAIRILSRTPYLRHLGMLVALGACCQSLFEYVLKATAAQHFHGEAELIAFFAQFYLGLSIATFLIQNIFTKRLLENYGLSATISTEPIMAIALGLLAFLFP